MFMRLTVLGCNGPYPAPEGACSGYLVEAEGAALQLDLGSNDVGSLAGHILIILCTNDLHNGNLLIFSLTLV